METAMETEMTFEERNTCIYAAVTVASFGVYLAIVLGRARSGPIAEVHYVAPMLWSIGGAIVASILGHIAVAIAWPRDCDKKDQRDREIHRFGEYIGQSFGAIGSVAALVLAMAEVAHFWIANAVYLGCVLSTLLGSAAKLVAYRRGFQSC
jgi:hypothetical protein